MNVVRFISSRYLFSKKHVSLISILTGISIAGITIGTALLIVILSVFNGFFDVIRGFLLSFDPDIRIVMADEPAMNQYPDLLDVVRDHPDVSELTPFIEGSVMFASTEGRNEVVTARGVERGGYIRLKELENSVNRGVFDLSVQNNRPGVVISEALSNRFGIDPGDETALLSTVGMRRALTQFSAPRASRFQVRGSYSIQQILEGDVVYIDLVAAQRLFNMQNQVTGYDLKLTDTDKAPQVKRDLEELLGADYTVSSWYDLQKPLYDVMMVEKWGSYIILMIIIFVAALNIVGSLTMIVLQKRKDIGILISMGMSKKRVRQIFQAQGFRIGLIGCGIGGTAGILLALAQQQFGLVKLSSAFIISAYPVSINPWDILLILGVTMLLCVAASWYPSLRAAAVEPADAVRNE
ncbi:MAG: FtsX-like permease family protein [Bacteroidetes bacterium]|jgi:lipoprotein-releasing system permease protein|nr:FtsX-like permease family protein [Bacteroidota bacterium]